MLQTIILVTLSFIAGILVGIGGFYQYANHIYMKHPEFIRKVLEYKIGKRHACQHVMDDAQINDPFCGNPASNQCEHCRLWFCDLHFNQSWQRCLPDKEVKIIRE